MEVATGPIGLSRGVTWLPPRASPTSLIYLLLFISCITCSLSEVIGQALTQCSRPCSLIRHYIIIGGLLQPYYPTGRTEKTPCLGWVTRPHVPSIKANARPLLLTIKKTSCWPDLTISTRCYWSALGVDQKKHGLFHPYVQMRTTELEDYLRFDILSRGLLVSYYVR